MRALLCIDQREAVEALIQELPKFMLKAVPTDCSECPICLEEFRVGNEVRGLPCAHNFHVECIDQWLRLNVKCPRCRCSVFPNLNLSALSNLRTSDILSYSNSANQVTTTVSSTQYVLSQQPPGQNYLLRLQGLLRPVIRSKLPDVAASPVENGHDNLSQKPQRSDFISPLSQDSNLSTLSLSLSRFMAKHRRSPAPSSDRQKWEGIFKSMVEMLQSLQSQAETLADERKFLGEYIHIQHDHWSSKVRLLQSHVAQLKKEEVKRLKMQVSKLDLLVGMKQSEAVLYKKQYELAETDLEDFRACMENLCAELSELKGKLKSGEPAKRKSGVCGDSRPAESSKGDDQCTAAIEIEIRKLKQSYKRLSSKKESEISALLSEKDFVWNQLKKMESDYTAIIKAKKIEVQQANEAVGKLKNNIQELQQSVNEKDEMIANLKSRHELDKRMHTEGAEKANEKIEQLQLEIEELQSLAKEKDGLIAKLRSELEMDVRNYTTGKSRFSKKQLESSSKTPSDSNPKRGSRKRVSNSAKENGDQKRKCLIDGSSGSRASAPVNGLVRCSSRRRTRTATPVERPALFHANFKVPKLKDSPSGAL